VSEYTQAEVVEADEEGYPRVARLVLDAAVLYSVPANREAQYQGAPAGSPPVVVGTFELNGDTIKIIPTVGMFITMNPGYAGRTELPENLKALFRSCAMIRPDLALICEIMLMAEGFLQSKLLARKFVILYRLCEDLLSKAPHYDWKLRAIKTTLYVAGGLKRSQPDLTEDKVLIQALRDFNLGKGEFFVVHLSIATGQVVGLERHRP
jgi:dynein heavy chain